MACILARERGTDVQRPKLMSDTAYEVIKRAIIRCELQPGAPITEDLLIERYALGRAAVRAAVKRLYQEQLIQSTTSQRYEVAPITLGYIQDLFEMRLVLEPHAAQQAAARIPDDDIRRLRDLNSVAYSPGTEGSFLDFSSANAQFHLLVARSSGNRMLLTSINELLDRSERVAHLSHLLLLEDRHGIQNHRHDELVEAFDAKDGKRAARVMAEHIESTKTFMLNTFVTSPSVSSVNISVAENGRGPS